MNETAADRKTALVFGGSRGIGAATVQALAAAGYNVALTYRTVAPDPIPAAKVGSAVRAYAVDIRDRVAVQRVFETVAADFGGPPACVVANAGINLPSATVAEVDPEAFRELVEVNLVGAFNILQAAGQYCLDGGAIIALTTSLVRHAAAGVGPYSATKAAVECLVRSMQKEVAPRGIRVNAVAPGPVDTDLFRAGKSEEALQRSAALSPYNRVGTPKEVAAVITFLASDKASWMAGQIVQPNGGLI